MKTLFTQIQRNIRLFFCDKGMFFTSMITPMILILLFVTFLGQMYRDSLLSAVPEGIALSDRVVEGFVGGWLFSSLLAVCTVTVSFCSNLLMVQDKVTRARDDFAVSPVKSSTLALAYFIASAVSTLIICFTALGVCFVYLGVRGWYLSFADVLFTVLDVVLLVLFGTALSSILGHFLSTQGQISAVGTIVSSVYGFLCGAYLPISQFGAGLRALLSFLPGTYGTALLHHHLMRGAFSQLSLCGLPSEAVEELKTAFDARLTVLGHTVTPPTMYAVLGGTVTLLLVIYLLLCRPRKAKRSLRPR